MKREARKRARIHGPLENLGHIMPKPGQNLDSRRYFSSAEKPSSPGSPLPSLSTDNAERNIYARTLECFSKALYE